MEKDQLLPSAPTTAQSEHYNGYQEQQPPPPPPYQQVPPYPQYGYQYPTEPGCQYGASSYCNTTANTVVIQPPQIVTATVLPPPPDYLPLSIFASLCCCCPIGIFAIFTAVQSRNRYDIGDHVEAVKSANTARGLSVLAMVCGTVLLVILVPLWIIR